MKWAKANLRGHVLCLLTRLNSNETYKIYAICVQRKQFVFVQIPSWYQYEWLIHLHRSLMFYRSTTFCHFSHTFRKCLHLINLAEYSIHCFYSCRFCTVPFLGIYSCQFRNRNCWCDTNDIIVWKKTIQFFSEFDRWKWNRIGSLMQI